MKYLLTFLISSWQPRGPGTDRVTLVRQWENFILLKYSFVPPMTRGWLTLGMHMWTRSWGTCPQDAAVQPICWWSPSFTRAWVSLTHRISFSGHPGAGRQPLSAAFSTWNLILWTSYPAGKGEPSKVTDVSSQGQENTYTETFVSVPELWLICLLGHNHSNASFLSYSCENKTGKNTWP